MREILFRGKRKDNGEWVEGGSIFKLINKSGDHFFIPQLGEKLIATHDDNMMNIVALENMTMYRVDPETVGQFTGLRDCKRTAEYPEGQMIFEGDIVEVVTIDTNEVRRTAIGIGMCEETGDDVPVMGVYCDYFEKPYVFPAYMGEYVEVIGNIHDNLEILKEGGEE